MLLAVVVVVVAAVVVYLVKEKLEHWLNCVKIVRKLAYLISFFSVCESSKLNPCGEKGICTPDYSRDSFRCKCDTG